MATRPVKQSSINGSVQRDPTDNPASPDEVSEPGSDIDLKTLAEKVYALLKKDLQIERERLGRRR
jgi:hypothetical protein